MSRIFKCLSYLKYLTALFSLLFLSIPHSAFSDVIPEPVEMIKTYTLSIHEPLYLVRSPSEFDSFARERCADLLASHHLIGQYHLTLSEMRDLVSVTAYRYRIMGPEQDQIFRAQYVQLKCEVSSGQDSLPDLYSFEMDPRSRSATYKEYIKIMDHRSTLPSEEPMTKQP